MSAKELCQNYFLTALDNVHAKRANSLFEASWGLTGDAKLTLSSLGRHKAGKAAVKNKIKSVDRLLGNQAAHAEQIIYYQALAKPYLQPLDTVYIAVDWSGCCGQTYHLLRAVLLYDGRGVTLYNEIHPQQKVGNNQVHKRFLANLAKVIPFGKKVVIVTDGGFATPWFKAVEGQGWDYVGRVNRGIGFLLNGSWINATTICEQATKNVKFIGHGRLGKKSATPVNVSLFSYREPPKNRKDKSRYPDSNKRYRLMNTSAWVLVTSLMKIDANQVKNIYKKRMQIEQNFRDDKNPRFGFGWRYARTQQPQRIAILCLIACVAAFFLWWIGLQAEHLGLQRAYQANTVRDKRVLSLPFLAKQVLLHEAEKIQQALFYQAAQAFIKNYETFILER